MRKTMIFRSRTWLLVAGVTLGGQTLQAQIQTPVPEVHVVSEGETLWDLAERYFGDPFLWPEIYRLNTLVVEDPHWIFPGEELRLAGMPMQPVEPPDQPTVEPVVQDPQAQPVQQQPPTQDPTQQTPDVMPPATPPPPPTDMSPTVFAPSAPAETAGPARQGSIRVHRPVRRGEFYASGFLTEDELLPFGRVIRAVGQVEMNRLPDASSALLYGELEVEAPAEASYRVSDTLLMVRSGGKVKNWGEVVVPTGIAVVTVASSDGVFVEIVQQYDRIDNGQRLLPLEPFVDPGSVVPIPTNTMLEGTVIQSRDGSPLPGQQDVVFFDVGRADGVDLGDIFVILKKPAKDMVPTDTVAFGQIVHRRENSSSAILGFIRSIGVEPGAVIRLFRKMP